MIAAECLLRPVVSSVSAIVRSIVMFQDKPLIALSCTSNHQPLTSRVISNPMAYSNAIAAAGGIPVYAPECLPTDFADLCDGLLLTGGMDIDPTWYREDALNESVELDALRDPYEFELTRAFLARKKPILAICRGFQLINVALGGDLYQDLLAQMGFVHQNSQIRHPFYAEEGSILHQLFGPVFRVNSTHHQAVRKLGKGLKVTGTSVEGIVESFESEDPEQLIWGTQFHPERLTGVQWDDRTPDFAPYFAAFVEKVKEHAGQKTE